MMILLILHEKQLFGVFDEPKIRHRDSRGQLFFVCCLLLTFDNASFFGGTQKKPEEFLDEGSDYGRNIEQSSDRRRRRNRTNISAEPVSKSRKSLDLELQGPL